MDTPFEGRPVPYTRPEGTVLGTLVELTAGFDPGTDDLDGAGTDGDSGPLTPAS